MNDDDIGTLLRQARATSEANSDPGVERPPPPTLDIPWWVGLVPTLLGLAAVVALGALGVWYFYGLAVDTGFLPSGGG